MNDTTIGEYLKNKKSESRHMTDYFYPGALTSSQVLLKVMDDSILNPYDALLDKYKKSYTYNKEEYRKYKYNPWRVALDVYGSTEYWFLPIHANQLYSANEFDARTVNMYTTDVIPVIDEIIAISNKQVRQETSKLNKMLKDVEFQINSEINKYYNTKIVKTYSY